MSSVVTGSNPPVRSIPPRTVARDLDPLAKRPVFAIAGGLALVLLVASGSYDYFGDELYFIAAGEHLAWGYADQQPALPLLASALNGIVPNSPLVLRLPSVLATATGVVITALIARELGGNGRAQVLAAATYALCPHFLVGGRLLATSTLDPFLWTVLTWLLVRWVRLHRAGRPDDRLLVWISVLTAVALQVKFLIPGLWVAVLVAVLLAGPRRLLLRPALWVGGLAAALTFVPTMLWQQEHGWPQLGMQEVIRSESRFTQDTMLPDALIIAGLVGAALLCYGLLRLLRSPGLRPYRFLGLAFLLLTALFLVVGARSYYLSGLYPVVWAAGAVELQRYRMLPRIAWPTCVLTAVISLSVLTPRPLVGAMPGALYNNAGGWEDMADDVTVALESLPGQPRAALLATDYWTASALQQYDTKAPVYSGSRGYGYFGRPSDDTDTVLYVGGSRENLTPHFASVRYLSSVDAPDTPHDGKAIWLAEEPTAPWSRLWPRLRGMGMYQ